MLLPFGWAQRFAAINDPRSIWKLNITQKWYFYVKSAPLYFPILTTNRSQLTNERKPEWLILLYIRRKMSYFQQYWQFRAWAVELHNQILPSHLTGFVYWVHLEESYLDECRSLALPRYRDLLLLLGPPLAPRVTRRGSEELVHDGPVEPVTVMSENMTRDSSNFMLKGATLCYSVRSNIAESHIVKILQKILSTL